MQSRRNRVCKITRSCLLGPYNNIVIYLFYCNNLDLLHYKPKFKGHKFLNTFASQINV